MCLITKADELRVPRRPGEGPGEVFATEYEQRRVLEEAEQQHLLRAQQEAQ